MPGSRDASMVLPAPGGPSRKTWCPPAAATSMRLDGVVVAAHVGEVAGCVGSASAGVGRVVDGGTGSTWRSSYSPPCQMAASSSDATPTTRMPGTSAASVALPVGTMHGVVAGARRGEHRGQDAVDRAQPPVEPELAEVHHAIDGLGREFAGRGETGDRDGEVEAGAVLRQRGRREVDGELARRQRAAGVDRGRAHAVARLAERGIGQADDDEGGQLRREVGLDLDDRAGEPEQGDRAGAGDGHQLIPSRCSMSAGDSAGASTATASMRMRAADASLASHHAIARRRSRASLTGVIASNGCP